MLRIPIYEEIIELMYTPKKYCIQRKILNLCTILQYNTAPALKASYILKKGQDNSNQGFSRVGAKFEIITW